MEIEFIDELPPGPRGRSGNKEFWDALIANPGRWAQWPGSARSSAGQLAAMHSRNGRVFEGRKRNGKTYFRCTA